MNPRDWRDWRDIAFPMLQPHSRAEQARIDEEEAQDRQAIKESAWRANADVALDEARRLADAEAERRRNADQKASTYLAVVAALVPLSLAVATAIWEGKAGTAPTWVNMLLLALAVIYVAAAGFWAFRVLEVSASARVGALDLVKTWRKRGPRTELIREILWSARLNQRKVNQKVSGIKMAHAFLLRAFLTFTALLLFNIAWFLIQQTFPRASATQAQAPDPPPAHARGLTEIEALRTQLRSGRSATEVLDRWCAAHGMAPAGAVVADKLATAAPPATPALRQRLRVGPNEAIAFRHVRLRCRDHILSEAFLWYVPARLPTEINRRLEQSDMPFGRAAAPLGYRRQPLSERRFWPDPGSDAPAGAPMPVALFELSALLVLPDGAPLAYVRETYRRDVLDFPPPR